MSDTTRKADKFERTLPLSAEVKPRGNKGVADSLVSKQKPQSPMFSDNLMEEICERENLHAALKRVIQNKGAPGIDGMTVEQLTQHLKENWLTIRRKLLDGSHKPNPVRRVEIPKPNGKDKRKLGIPCVVDRFIQQAMLQVLQRGFRPNILRIQLWFQAGKICPSGSSSSSNLSHSRVWVCC